MKKIIGFFLPLTRDEEKYTDYKAPNPGIGGAEFLAWTLAAHLAENESYKIHVYSPSPNHYGGDFFRHTCSSLEEFFDACEHDNLDAIVVNGPFFNKSIWRRIKNLKIKIYIWSHNFEDYRFIWHLKRCNKNVVNVCVSYDQKARLYDTDIWERSVVIHNALNFDNYPKGENKSIISNRIVYMGNLYPRSGYKQLIQLWPRIKKINKDIVLVIIGGNDLYAKSLNSSSSKKKVNNLHKLEKKVFYDSLDVENGRVIFTGVLAGDKKIEMMKTGDLAIANITTRCDTFGLSALEFERLGVPVVSINRGGVQEVVKNNETGILVKDYEDIPHAIQILLSDKKRRTMLSESAAIYAEKKYNIYSIIEVWDALFDNTYRNNEEAERKALKKHPRIIKNKKIKKYLFFVPTLQLYTFVYRKGIRVLEKLNII